MVVARVGVAALAVGEAFGRQLASAAWEQGLLSASRRAFVADGASLNWAAQQKWFARFVPIADFIHTLTCICAAAWAGRSFADGWPVYQDWVAGLWRGAVERVREALAARHKEMTKSDPGAVRAVQDAVTYLSNHGAQMDYASYRRQGFPITSSLMESTVKQVSRRVKGTEKFWSESGAEAVLQLRADYLSAPAILEEFWRDRPRRQTGQRAHRRQSA